MEATGWELFKAFEEGEGCFVQILIKRIMWRRDHAEAEGNEDEAVRRIRIFCNVSIDGAPPALLVGIDWAEPGRATALDKSLHPSLFFHNFILINDLFLGAKKKGTRARAWIYDKNNKGTFRRGLMTSPKKLQEKKGHFSKKSVSFISSYFWAKLMWRGQTRVKLWFPLSDMASITMELPGNMHVSLA